MKLLFLIAILISLSFASALNISAQYNSNVLIPEIDSSIDLTLTITNATPGTYNLYTLADITTTPSEIFTISTDPFIKTFTISPTENLDVDGYYTFTYILNHRGFEKTEEKFLAKILKLEDTIEVGSDTIDPASGEVKFYVKNLESTTLKNLEAKFSSILFSTEATFDLGPNQKLEFTANVSDDKLKKTKAGIYIIESTFQTKDGKKKIEGNLYLGEKKGITTTEDKSGILIRTQTITKTNAGNVLENVQVQATKNIFSRLFTTFNIEPDTVERKGFAIEYSWLKQKLNPTETFTIKARTNYIFPFLIIVVVTLALFGFKRFTETKVEVKKSVHHVRTKHDEFALKINLSLKAKKNVENVTLIDKVPAIVKIYNKFGMNKPDKIDAASRRIHWNIGDLNAGEERLFSYIVYSKVGVIGKFALPEATVVFEQADKIHEVESNKIFFMSDQIRKD
ncbi:MAG: hypothetical protein V1889_02920 [archaeon]